MGHCNCSAGRIEIKVSTPYPVWCNFYLDGEHIGKFHHKELADLQYVTERAMKEARSLLREDCDEV